MGNSLALLTQLLHGGLQRSGVAQLVGGEQPQRDLLLVPQDLGLAVGVQGALVVKLPKAEVDAAVDARMKGAVQ